ncbi:LacI family DNA-binding transcriptional regulator [Delftia sp. PS-11]|uniref:LacI family DNA-binding transcriptional regulator n=1 Tax=Delftia sp. PS-11 TaxID=2767222 RepID=UPI002456E3B7|nr:LacI family DNA-binding transcriptional regulator [Delftia sp. PS-11]KAJ8740864.1 LacI family DNA-binding transcriptional regulator [Delftia sp. PS-11]
MTTSRITLKDVARAAGVATGTVSMVLNDSPLVAEATRAHVRQVMRELGYVYDRAAAHLRNRRSRIVGVSVCDLVNPYYADVTAGIQATLEQLGLALVLGNCAESTDRQLRFMETLREYNAEGLLITPAIGTPTDHLQQVLQWNIPVVQVSRYIHGVQTDYVGIDNRLATEMAARHLLSLGHERLAYIGLNKNTSTGQDRFAGFQQAMQAHGLDPAGHVIECGPSRKNGFNAVLDLFKAAHPPTGLVCFNDDLAFGAMLGLRQLGLEPGRDCSVVGVDDVAEAALWYPALTTVSTDREKMGQEAARLLTRRIAEPGRAVESVVLEPVLTVRQSSRVPPKPKAARRRQPG